MKFQVSLKQQPWFVQLLRYPMFWVAIAVHGFVLFVPLSSTENPAPPKPDEAKGVKLTKLTVAPKRSKAAAPKPVARRQATIRRKAPPPPPVVVKSTTPPEPTEAPENSAKQKAKASPNPKATKSPKSPGAEEGIEVDAQTGAIVEGIDGALETLFAEVGLTAEDRQNADNAISSISFPNETLPYFFSDPDKDEIKAGIKSVRYAPNIETDTVQTFLQAKLAGYTITSAGEYGTQPLYKLEKGKVIRYLSLVSGKKPGRATFILLWEKKPG